MFLSRFPLQKHSDARGTLVQNDYPELFKEMNHFLVSSSAPGVIRGNHYHEHKREWFLLIQGEAEFVTEDIKTKERAIYHVSATTPELIETETYIAHAIKNVGKSEMLFIGFVNEVFDTENPDTFPYHII